MKLKTKLTLSIASLVLLVVLAVTLVYLAGNMRQQLQQVDTHANFLAHAIYNQMSQEWSQAGGGNGGSGSGQAALDAFLRGLPDSSALENLFSSAIGYNGSIRDVALVAPSGVVILDSNPLLEGHPQPQRPAMANIAGDAAGLWRQVLAVLGPEAIYSVNLGVQAGGEPLGTIAVGVDTVLLRQQMLGRMRSLLFYGVLIVLLATILAWSLAELALAPLAAISAQLDRLVAVPEPGGQGGDELGRVQSKIERLGQEIQDTRQIYTTLQENVGHVLSGLDLGLMLFDARGQSAMASAAMPELLGIPAGELVGRPVEELFPGGSGLDAVVRQAVRQNQSLQAHESERHAGGRRLLARLDLIRDRGGEAGALLTLRDAEPLQRLEGELEVARRLSAVGRLTRGVAHEVKNPLNAMAIHLDLLRTKATSGGDGLGPHIEVLGREIERLDRVVRTFLDFTRPVELRLAPADLSEVAAGVEQLVQAEAEAKGVRIELDAHRPGPRVWLDRDLIEQALLNLVNNGLQAMEQSEAGRRRLRLEVRERPQQGLIRVRDFGPGVAAEHRDKIFDLYFTTRGEGSGIGLALAARIMQLHQGSIELEAEAGDGPGASFVLHFPVRAEEAARGEH